MDVIRRHAVRTVLLTPEGRMLRIRYEEKTSGFRVWVAPGGGLEDGEDPEACLRRELAEETGLTGCAIGPMIWTRHHDFDWDGQDYSQSEEYRLVRVPEFTPRMIDNPSPVEAEAFRGFRWWSVKEIEASEDEFAPRALARHLDALIRTGPPPSPLDVGV